MNRLHSNRNRSAKSKILAVVASLAFVVGLSPVVASASDGGQELQTADTALLAVQSSGEAAGFTVSVRDLGLEATNVANCEGYADARIIDNSGTAGAQNAAALVDRNGNLLFDYTAGVSRFWVSDGVVTKYVDPTFGNVSPGIAGHYTLDGNPLYSESYDFVYPYSEGVAVAVNIAREGRDSADTGLFLLDKEGNRTLSLGGPFGVVKTKETKQNGQQVTVAFLAGVHSETRMVNGLIPFYLCSNSSADLPSVGDNLADVTVDVDNAIWDVHGFMDKTGTVVIAPKYVYAANFSDNGLALARNDSVTAEPWFFIDSSGAVAINGRDSEAWPGGFRASSGFVDASVAAVSKAVTVAASEGDPNLGYDSNGNGYVVRYGYINGAGETVVPFEYDGAFGASQYDLCTVGKKGSDGTMKYGVVTTANEVVVPLEWDDISVVHDNVAYGIKDGRLYAIDVAPASGGTGAMHRLYNPNSGEHFYTADDNEMSYLVSIGWIYEGVGWTAPGANDQPVYRLYNRNAGDHHYTLDPDERAYLISIGWEDENIGWYSAGEEGAPLYRQYNPNATGAGSHNYTADENERDWLVNNGWNDEGIGWYGVPADDNGGNGQPSNVDALTGLYGGTGGPYGTLYDSSLSTTEMTLSGKLYSIVDGSMSENMGDKTWTFGVDDSTVFGYTVADGFHQQSFEDFAQYFGGAGFVSLDLTLENGLVKKANIHA